MFLPPQKSYTTARLNSSAQRCSAVKKGVHFFADSQTQRDTSDIVGRIARQAIKAPMHAQINPADRIFPDGPGIVGKGNGHHLPHRSIGIKCHAVQFIRNKCKCFRRVGWAGCRFLRHNLCRCHRRCGGVQCEAQRLEQGRAKCRVPRRVSGKGRGKCRPPRNIGLRRAQRRPECVTIRTRLGAYPNDRTLQIIQIFIMPRVDPGIGHRHVYLRKNLGSARHAE